MGISSALYAGVSGLNTLGASMSVIGDNIANVNTIGFKSARSTFETLLAQNITGASGTSQVGRGVALSAVDAVFAQGSFESTNEATDMAIGGKGFFMVRSPQTGLYYTRAGHFKFDEEGYLVNPAGLRVQGWILDPSSIAPRGAITDIKINATSSAPNPTSEINIAVNLQNSSLFIETPATVETNELTAGPYTITAGTNDTFSISVDGGNAVNVTLTPGTYSIWELRKEIEDEINAALAADGQSVDVRYDENRNVLQFLSSSRGGRTSRIQVTPRTGSTSNFLPTINMTDYTEHLGETSNGYTIPGYTQSAGKFIVTSSNNTLVVDGTNIITVPNGYYTGDGLAEILTNLLSTKNISVAYSTASGKFTFTNNDALQHTLNWNNPSTTIEALMGFDAVDDTLSPSGGTAVSDSAVDSYTVSAGNNTFNIIVNGNPKNDGSDVLVTIDTGTYTATKLATELESEINEALNNAGESERVTVTYDEVTQRFTIASTKLGENSSIQLNTDVRDPGPPPIKSTFLQDIGIDDETVNYGIGFDVDNPDDTANYSTSLVVYDSLGNQHTLTFYFRKAYFSEDDLTTQWEWFAYVPAADSASGKSEIQARGLLTFNQNGTLIGQSQTEWLTTQADGSPGEGFNFSGGASPQQLVDIDFGLNAGINLSTQYASPSSTIFQTQDGFGSGFLQEVATDADGVISGLYSNGQVLYLARVALANFINPWGLSRQGGNLWSETRASGQPITGTPGTAGLGKIAPNSLEQSNVDLSTEFVNMIIQQRGFQANSRIITTTDDMLAELINLKR